MLRLFCCWWCCECGMHATIRTNIYANLYTFAINGARTTYDQLVCHSFSNHLAPLPLDDLILLPFFCCFSTECLCLSRKKSEQVKFKLFLSFVRSFVLFPSFHNDITLTKLIPVLVVVSCCAFFNAIIIIINNILSTSLPLSSLSLFRSVPSPVRLTWSIIFHSFFFLVESNDGKTSSASSSSATGWRCIALNVAIAFFFFCSVLCCCWCCCCFRNTNIHSIHTKLTIGIRHIDLSHIDQAGSLSTSFSSSNSESLTSETQTGQSTCQL